MKNISRILIVFLLACSAFAAALGEADVTGTVSGDQVEFSFKVSPAGEEMTVTYKGTITAPDKMKGTVTLGTVAEGTWEGAKKQ